MDFFDASPVGAAARAALESILYRVVCEETLGTVPQVDEYNKLIDGGFAAAVNGVQPYSVNNCETPRFMTRDRPPTVVGFSVHYIGAYGLDLCAEHLPGGARAGELEATHGITAAALERALCSRDGRSVCSGCPVEHVPGCVPATCACRQAHVVHFPDAHEAQASRADYVLPLVIGIRRYVYKTHPQAAQDVVYDAALKINEASFAIGDRRGCYAFNLVSTGELSEAAGGPMVLVEGGAGYAYVTREAVPRPVGSRGCTSGTPQDGDFVIGGQRKTFRHLLRGATEQIQVTPEPRAAAAVGHKAKMRRHVVAGDDLVVSTLWVSDVMVHGSGRSTNRLPQEVRVSRDVRRTYMQGGAGPSDAPAEPDDEALAPTPPPADAPRSAPAVQTRSGMWVGAMWAKYQIPLALLFLALGVTDDRTLLALLGYDETDEPQQRTSLVQSVIASKILVEPVGWMAGERAMDRRARLFIVEHVYKWNRHEEVSRGSGRDVAAMLAQFREVVLPRVLEGVASPKARLATLSWMAIRTVRATREMLRAADDPHYTPEPAVTDLDHVGELRVYTLGRILGQEMRKAMRRSLGTQMANMFAKYERGKWNVREVRHAFKFGDGANALHKMFVSGNLQVGNRQISGVSVASSDTSPLDTFAKKYTLYKEGNTQSPASMRAAHPTAYGLVCPVHTPEGENIGLVTHAALGLVVSPDPPPDIHRQLSEALRAVPAFVRFDALPGPPRPAWLENAARRPRGVESLLAFGTPGVYRVVMDGIVVGGTPRPLALIRAVRQLRRTGGRAFRFVSVCLYRGAVVVQTSCGRLGRYLVVLDEAGRVPLPPAERALLLGSWADYDYFTLERLLDAGVLEWVSALEGESVKIATGPPVPEPVDVRDGVLYEAAETVLARAHGARNPRAVIASGQQRVRVDPDMPLVVGTRTDGAPMVLRVDTHAEPHPGLILGVAAAVSGFTECNQSARNNIGAVHTVQAVGRARPGELTGARFSSAKSRATVDVDVCATKVGAFLPARPGRIMRLVAVVSNPWCSEDAQVATQWDNDLDERALLRHTVQYEFTGLRRAPNPVADKADEKFLAFPGEHGDNTEIARVAARGTAFGEYAGVLADGGEVYEFSAETVSDDGVSVYKSIRRHIDVAYSKIGADGLPCQGTRLVRGDAVIGAVAVGVQAGADGEHEIYYRDVTVTYDEELPGTVETVFVTDAGGGRTRAVVNVVVYKAEDVGDKFALPFGQKGVNSHVRRVGEELTIAHPDPRLRGIRVSRDFGANGYSRMTVGVWRQMVVNWLAIVEGRHVRGTFGECRYDDGDLVELQRRMRRAGLDRYGRFPLRNPETGEIIGRRHVRVAADGTRTAHIVPEMFFCGYVAVNAQPHWAFQKCRATSRAKRDPLTRQPIKREGLRFGEMEKDCAVAHGAASVLRDRFSADSYQLHVCTVCGFAANFNYKTRASECLTCGPAACIVQIRIPYAKKLMMQELQAMCVREKFEFTDDGVPIV